MSSLAAIDMTYILPKSFSAMLAFLRELPKALSVAVLNALSLLPKVSCLSWHQAPATYGEPVGNIVVNLAD